MARTPMLERNDNKYVPKFKETHTSTGGRVYGIRHVPQTAMFEITGEGAGDLPAGLKGYFTSTGRAERSLKSYLQTQKQLLEALEAKQAREKDEAALQANILKIKKAEEAAKAAEAEDKDVKNASKVPLTAKSGDKSDKTVLKDPQT